MSFSAPPQNQINPQVQIQQRRKGQDPGQDQATVLKDGGEDWFVAKLGENYPVKWKVKLWKLGCRLRSGLREILLPAEQNDI